ncbi:pca operon transcription factor PcaQ [Marivivens sp. LCG002]|uniref:pca operon transcription factor PcaQ n=1 Tax=Marivivens sp. LCG002 TaxID=3051171 RepID=UPI002556207D|nr:pca operon transcription factor PcaQ [Marivivens sp. LCG002]WIV50678.1 pca operon transcription factor PcaQ [Marivivens sp. LCG002]
MIDRRIKFRHVQCFVEIARHRSLKRAADRLFLTQPAISKTLKELEDILGAQLLNRSRAGVTLTREGDVFLQFAEMSVGALQQGIDGVGQVSATGGQTLTVGALPSVAAWLLPSVVREMAEVAPDVVLRVSDGPHAYLVDRLRQGALDLVIGRLGAPETMQQLSFTQLYNEHVEFVVRPGHPILNDPRLERIAEWPVVYPSPGSAILPLVERFLIANGIGDLPRRIETVSGAFGRVYVRNSDAVWIISAGVVANELAEGRLVRLPIDTALTRGPVGLMARPDEDPSPPQRFFRIAVNRALEELGLVGR